jgi:hypothetical protein
MAAAAIWNLSKYPEIMGGITRFLSVSDTLERLAAKGVPMKRPPASVLMEALPSVLREATVNLGELNTELGGEPYFALGVKLARYAEFESECVRFRQRKGERGFTLSLLSLTLSLLVILCENIFHIFFFIIFL